MSTIFKRLEELYPEMVDIRRKLHAEPELSFHEVKTPAFIANYLEDLGVEVKRGVGGRGVVGYIKGELPGKTVALRADFDALPIHEDTGLDFSSNVPGVMHACGHDGHTATLLVCAKVLMEHRDQLKGTIVLIHQFAEELAPGGAIEMIKDGCLEGVDVIYGTHLWNPLPLGEVGYRSGPIMAASDRFEVTIQGRGGHGAAPHETIDAVTVGSSVVQNLQHVVSRQVDPLKSAVVTTASFQAGGPFNVIADTAELIGTARSFEEDVQELVIDKMEQMIKGVCEGMGASYTFKYVKGYPAVVNDGFETERFAKVAKEIHSPELVVETAPVMGGEDFAYYLKEVPGTFFFTGSGNPSVGADYPHHHPKFTFDEQAMLLAGKLLVQAAITYQDQ
ncbi:M20 family metallopeptidase [Alkalicoccobacillus plakortidis]|uniref:M20 family metallopeptidase n=1 Tax=Alkalicoccobacillus plakortidis TaxID=444060 RepID=A0ABT0XEI0_9BACI|nr:M20 family metallopeptidase [Alkalicoccobacillus plakortidis]MCM2674301.1 M20 family metallopeptidase [Alkalicoccobacillus plakortidis]